MANEFNSKIVLSNGEVLIDLTQDDVKPEHVDEGVYFTDKTGKRQQGTSKKTVDASGVTAEAAEVLNGRTFGKGKEVQVGPMPDNSGQNVEITSKEGTSILKGYQDGSSKAMISEADKAKLIPGNIKKGVTILEVEGTFGAEDMASQSKEITPTFADQTIVPDEGYTFLSSVNVKGIPITRTDNEAGGVTVTIG